MEDDQQFCLRWNNHQSTLISVFDTLLENQTLVDCTLAAEGKFLKAHKVVLSACSPFFATLLQQQYDKHPIFILKDVKYQELRAMMDYMYRGEVNISQDQLAALLKAAESLQIKGLSDNRSGSTPKTEQHRSLNVPGSGSGGKLSGYTLEQTQSKRPRVGPSPMEPTDISGSREGSSSPSRRRRKVRRRSVENAMSEVHDNSNSSQINQSSLQPQQQQQQPQTNASVTGVGAIMAATSSLPVSASTLSSGSSGVLAATGSIAVTQGSTQQMTTNITKKTESVKGVNDAINTENIQAVGVAGTGDEQNVEHLKGDKSNHKQKSSTAGVAGKETAELVIEPKSEYEEEGNEETVEDLTLDDEEMGMEDLDQNAGTSQAGEGSSQGYAPWQHDRSQDELLLAPQETQQRDPQVKHDKSEQTDITPEEFELDDCLLESNDIVITQNKDGFVLHVKKLGNITTTAKIAPTDEDQTLARNVTDPSTQAHIADVQNIADVKPTLTTLTTSQIKLPSSECELINLKKIIPATTTIAPHQPAATIIQPHQFSQQAHPSHHQHGHSMDHPQQQQIQQLQSHPQVQSIVTTHPPHTQTINLMGLRNVQIAEQKPLTSRIKYSRGKIITPQSTTAGSVQIVESHEAEEPQHHHHHQLAEGTKYEISEIDLNNPSASAAIISDLVKYAEIDDIELPDGTKIGIGFAPTEITEHIQTTAPSAAHQMGSVVDEDSEQAVHHHHIQHLQQTQVHHHIHPHTHHAQLQLQEQDDATTSVEATILPDGITLHEQPTITKSYTILTTRPIKQEGGCASVDGTTTTTYELSLSDSSMHPDDGDAKYVCRHCGKKYRWKSTLRRHENVECGGKEPCHPCPHCSYKAKQRGNLGVHVRKHHPEKPGLESKRGRK
ncbi:PREDICTED: longitudinals lacking protein, isoforms F/I/K/T isoform X5 [Rhagoletis zephyria]|uniref:longitudinals lacking protein, isoforms F/I/K/T isoform X5 n=1 Tax=Rhagoletis zephyria TaxID=28612 RepID=UPI0008118653|nr:PREDICTED: longitudinals lacking protein, isoforms F/I/K/T isoform X5 [Rhagoletis zephyria]